MDHLLDLGPYDQPPTPNTEDGTPPPPAGEDTEVEESVGKNKLVDGEDKL